MSLCCVWVIVLDRRLVVLQAYWWAILLVILVVSGVMGIIICVFGRALDMGDP